jgi:hypothetical protein
MSLRFGSDLKGFNVDSLECCRPIERDGVRMNLVKAAKTTFDGSGDVGVGLLM